MQSTQNESTWAHDFAKLFESARTLPISFTYHDKSLHQMIDHWDKEIVAGEADRKTITYTDPESQLELRIELVVMGDLAAVEWTAYLCNGGSNDTAIIENIMPCHVGFDLPANQDCIFNYAHGAMASRDDFAPLKKTLRKGDSIQFEPGGGRGSSEYMPYFNLHLGTHGVVGAIGWSGEWLCSCRRENESNMVTIEAGQALTHLRLHGGEQIRTPKMALLFWDHHPIRGHNLLRSLILEQHSPHKNGQPIMPPAAASMWGGTPVEVHRENIELFKQHNLPIDYYWIDADWFCRDGKPWLNNSGNWTPREDYYPNGMEETAEIIDKGGMKFLLWFEPERIAEGTDWSKQPEEWLLRIPNEKRIRYRIDGNSETGSPAWRYGESRHTDFDGPPSMILNIGIPAAREFLTDYISECITKWRISCYRQDFNVAPHEYWKENDEPDRQGITEIRYIEGLYTFWDELLKRHPELIIDNCCSGGRRLDIEAISRSTNLTLTDFPFTPGGLYDDNASQAILFGAAHWVPISSLHYFPYGGEVEPQDYAFRSRMSSGVPWGLMEIGAPWECPIGKDAPLDKIKLLMEQHLELREYYLGDFYPLTSYSLAEDAWLAYQLDLSEKGQGMVLAFRREEARQCQAVFQLQNLEAAAEYEVRNYDTGKTSRMSGKTLSQVGLQIELAEQATSAVITYRKTH